MTRKTVQGRPVFLKKLKSGWAVRWGRTVIVRCDTWQGALFEIMRLFEEFDDERR